MKILHTSDWHLGQTFYNFNRENEFRSFFNQLHDIIKVEKPDAMLIAGDIFDTATPSNATVSMYNKELLSIQLENPGLQTIVTAGNHDSPSRLASAGVLWKEFGVTVVGAPERNGGEINMENLVVPIMKDGVIIAWVLAVPYMHGSSLPAVGNDSYEERVRSFYGDLSAIACEKRKEDQPIIAMGHLTLSNCDLSGHNRTIGTVDSVPVDIWSKGFSYVALGHIHHAQHIGDKMNVRYSGSVIPISFDEQYKHSVSIVEFDGAEMKSVNKIEIKSLMDVYTVPQEASSFEDVKEALRRFPNDKEAYVRANVLVNGVMPTDMFNEAQLCLNGKKAKFCGLIQKHAIQKAANDNENVIHSLDELKRITPIEVARKSYKIKRQEEMPEELEKCMQEAINNSKNSIGEER